MDSSQHNVPGQVLTVVGGRVMAGSYSSNVPFALNGQQLMMQLDSLTSAMTDMTVTQEEEMEGVMEQNIKEAKNRQSNQDLLIQQQIVQQHQEYLLQQQQYELEHQQQLQVQKQQQIPSYDGPTPHTAPASLDTIPNMSGYQKCVLWA
eukprot:GFUD01002880.1.p1 GENE.GFUD01002880.1~~GFUD01002880.1.p1  ORF type:complete len:148 (-),score=59.79 GFUD01002880.1:88-531(-)